MKNEIAKNETAIKLNEAVQLGLSAKDLDGFEKAGQIALAIEKLKSLMTPQYMAPIMKLQGLKLGFKADKVYSESVVKDCLIEAVLTGVQPVGNQFNIIAGNCYITKEGFKELLSQIIGLDYQITFDLPRINDSKTSAAAKANIAWSLNEGEKKTQTIDLPIKMNAYMGTDAVIGKGERKARAWLYNKITSSNIGDGDVEDIQCEIVSDKQEKIEENKDLFKNDKRQ